MPAGIAARRRTPCDAHLHRKQYYAPPSGAKLDGTTSGKLLSRYTSNCVFLYTRDETMGSTIFALRFSAALRLEPPTNPAKQYDRAVQQRSQLSVVPNVPGSPPLEIGIQ
jgi:hypothetical protein